MYYEIPKDAVADNHEVYAHLCGVTELAKAIQECLNSGRDTIKLKYCLESWEEDEDGRRINIKYTTKREVLLHDTSPERKTYQALRDVPMYDCVEISDVFNDKVNYIDLLAPHLKAYYEAKTCGPISGEGRVLADTIPISCSAPPISAADEPIYAEPVYFSPTLPQSVEMLLTNLNSQLHNLSSQLGGLKEVLTKPTPIHTTGTGPTLAPIYTPNGEFTLTN